jgi:hypothetical protein
MFLRRKEASSYLKKRWGISRTPETLAKFATNGGGPKFHYLGRNPVYQEKDLDLWVQSILSGPRSKTNETDGGDNG